MSSDFGALLLRGIDRQIGLTERLAAAMQDQRHQASRDHPLQDLVAQRISQIASGYAEGHDAKSLRHDPLWKLRVERPPLEPAQALASAPTFSRLAHRGDRKDRSRLTRVVVDHVIASDPEPPAASGLALDHADDPTHGQQELACYTHYSQSYCSRPLFMFAGPSPALGTACLRPGKRPTGAERAMIFVRRLASLRRHWPQTPLLVRGDRPCATPEVLEGMAHRRPPDCVCGLAGQAVLLRQAASVMQEARGLSQQRSALAQGHGTRRPASTRLSEACFSGAASWSQPWRVLVPTDVRAAGDHPRFVVPACVAPPPPQGYEALSCARGHGENDRKAVKYARHRDRTSATPCLANAMRLLLSCAADVLPHALRPPTLSHPALATAQPATVILTLFPVATQSKPYKDRMRLHLPMSCPVTALLHRVTALLSAIPVPALNPS